MIFVLTFKLNDTFNSYWGPVLLINYTRARRRKSSSHEGKKIPFKSWLLIQAKPISEEEKKIWSHIETNLGFHVKEQIKNNILSVKTIKVLEIIAMDEEYKQSNYLEIMYTNSNIEEGNKKLFMYVTKDEFNKLEVNELLVKNFNKKKTATMSELKKLRVSSSTSKSVFVPNITVIIPDINVNNNMNVIEIDKTFELTIFETEFNSE